MPSYYYWCPTDLAEEEREGSDLLGFVTTLRVYSCENEYMRDRAVIALRKLEHPLAPGRLIHRSVPIEDIDRIAAQIGLVRVARKQTSPGRTRS